MHRRSAPALGLRTFARLFAPGMFSALALILLCAGHAPAALASSNGNITTNPPSGPVGTAVQVEIRLYPDTAQPYILSATAADPAQGGCASAQPFPGLAPVTVGGQGGFVQITWPSAFASGQFWLCASPQGGTGPSAHSLQPYTVTSAADATATPASGYNPDSGPVAAEVVAPSDGAPAGSTVTVIVTGWATPDNAPPTTLNLVPTANGNAATSVPFVVAASPALGDFNLTVTLPVTTAPGQYYFEVGGARHTQTQNNLTVVAPVTPTVGGHSGSTGPGSASGGIPAIAIGAGVALLLLLAGAILVAAALGRRRAAAEERQRRQRAHDAGRHAYREEAWRR